MTGHYGRLGRWLLLALLGLSSPWSMAADNAVVRAHLAAHTRMVAMDLAAALKSDINDGLLELEARNRQIIIRFSAKTAFAPDTAVLRATFLPVLADVRERIKPLAGEIAVEGHTDDVPIATARFASNWMLSAARAAAVAYELVQDNGLAAQRLVVKGYADTRPLVPNTTAENRARNGRIEIVLDQGTEDARYLSGEKPLPVVKSF